MINQSYASPKFSGEPSPEALANGLATLGRYGDSYMVHATDGETLIPPEIFEANPKLKEDLFVQMRQMGVRDPERFVVGNSLNSINPITGQPEFFFKKIFRAVKKVFKKALPVIAPIVGNMIAPGIGGIIASGLVTKLQGGSWGDVAKGAALSYGLGALGQGVTGAMGGKGFMASLGKGLMAPVDAGKALFSGGPQNPLAQGVFGTGGQLFGQSTDLGLGFSGGDVARSEGVGGLFPTYQRDPMMASGFSASQPQHLQRLNAPADQVPFSEMGWRQKQAMSGQNLPESKMKSLEFARTLDRVADQNVYVNRSPADAAFEQNYVAAGGTSADTLGGSTSKGTAPIYKTSGTYPQLSDTASVSAVPASTADAVGQSAGQATEAAGTSLTGYKTLDKMLGQIAVPAALAGLTYFLADDEPELDPDQAKELSAPQRYAYDKYLARGAKKDAEGQALLLQAGVVPSTDPVALARATGATEEEARTWLGSMYGQPIPGYPAAKGGIITLQGGGEIMGPGSGTSDSIPARLSDGEFVMTADAVRGAGNGSRDMGAARMYDLMSRFERAA